MRIDARIREKTAAKRAGLPVEIIRIECRTGRLKALRWGRRGKFLIQPKDFESSLQEWRQQPERERLIPLERPTQRRPKQTLERSELEAQSQAQQRALQRFLDDGDSEGAAIVARALLARLAQLAEHTT